MDRVRSEEAAREGAAAAAARQQVTTQAGATEQRGTAGEAQGASGDAAIGKEFRNWFNDKLRQLPNPSISLGTKQAHAISLHEDGRFECVLVGAQGEGGQQFVAFEAQYLDQLVRKIAAIGL